MTDRSCMIVGGGRGMGAAIAREMHARGYRLALSRSLRVDGGTTRHM